MLLVVPCSRQFHAFFQGDSGRVAQFGCGPANVVGAATRQKLDATAREWSALAPHSWRYGKDIRGEVGKPERDTPCGGLPAQRMRDSCHKLANGDRAPARNVIAATWSLGPLSAQQKSGHQVIDIDRVQQGFSAIDGAKQAFFNRCEEA